jgi:regulator of sigma E protease
VLPASAAAEAGLLPGDVILAIDSNNIANAAEAGRAMVSKSPGDEIAIRLQRGSESRDLRIKLK